MKFFSKKVGSFDQTLNFEVMGSTKPFALHLTGNCEFPSINQNVKNVFMAHKKHRPHHAPDSYLSKIFVMSEKNFDFGPILVGKDPEKRGEDE